MSRPRPKFCVGEQVLALMINNNWIRTHIEFIEWDADVLHHNLSGEDKFVEGWFYYIEGMDPNGEDCHLESDLKKIPPENRIQWQDCAWQPKNLEEETIT